ncbi:hypothetical protein VZT92_010642 [Zoarces viviparus]|uniref:Uncharacterized protein n=1 Tax=Zoarces viviparus TaxID=48416 RepID=A0AAW1F9B9_ZOAVI
MAFTCLSLLASFFGSHPRTLIKQLFLCPPYLLSTCPRPHATLHCVHPKVSTFTAVEQRGVSSGAEAAACSRGPRPGSPYPIQLGFVIGSPGLKDTVHHLTRRNACKMSNQHRRLVITAASRQASFLQDGPGRPLSLMISGADLRILPLHTRDPPSQDSVVLGGKHARTWVPTIHQTR